MIQTTTAKFEDTLTVNGVSLTQLEAGVLLRILERGGKATVVKKLQGKAGKPQNLWEVEDEVILKFEVKA